MSVELEPERRKAIQWNVMAALAGLLFLIVTLALAWPLMRLTGSVPAGGVLFDPSWQPGFSKRWVDETARFITNGLFRHAGEWLPALWHELIAHPVAAGKPPHWTIFLAFGVGLAASAPLVRSNPYELHHKSQGSARFAEERDLERNKLLGYAGFILGRFKGRLIRLPQMTSVILIAPPGAGKSAGIMIPCLLAAWMEWMPVCGSEALGKAIGRHNRWPATVSKNSPGKIVRRPTWVVNDPKGELERKTSKAMQAKGYDARKLAFSDLNGSRWNPIGLDALPGGLRTVKLRQRVLAGLAQVYDQPARALADIMARVRDSTKWHSELATDPTLNGRAPLKAEIAQLELASLRFGRSPVRELLHALLGPLEELFALQARREQYVRRLAVMAIDEKIEPHWRDKGRAALVGGLLFTIYRCEMHPEHGEPSIGQFIDFLTEGTTSTIGGQEGMGGDPDGGEESDGNQKMLQEWLAEAMRDGHPARVITEFSSLLRTPSKERGSIISTMDGGVDIFKNPTVRRTTSASDFALDDMRFSSKPLAIYLVTPLEEAVSMGRVVGMFFESSAARMISQEEKDIETKGRPICYGADEFWTLPAGMESLMQIPALGRGQEVGLLLIGQSYGQIAIKINRDAVDVLKGATAAKVVLQQNDLDTAKQVSDAIGNRTVQNPSETTQEGGADFKSMFQKSINRSWTGQPLITAQRLMSLKVMKEQVVLVQGMTDRPVLCETPAWFTDPGMRAQMAGKSESVFSSVVSRIGAASLARLGLWKPPAEEATEEDSFRKAANASIEAAGQQFAEKSQTITNLAGPVPASAIKPPAAEHQPMTAEEARRLMLGGEGKRAA